MKNVKTSKISTGQSLYQKAKTLIPGATQLYSKRSELFAPDVWPAYYSKAKGCRVWDLDGSEYIDMSIMGIGSNILGYGDPEVDSAVKEAIDRGVSSTLNCPEDIELAELLIQIHPWAQMVRYARSGGEAMSVAIRIARAYTQKDIVLFNGYHGWTDWYLAANLEDSNTLDGYLMPGLEPKGVPQSLKGTSFAFQMNDLESLKKSIKGRERGIAAIVVELARAQEPSVEILEGVRNISSELGCVLIFDEITTGFRMNSGGIHLRYGVNPDMAVFAKSLANGYAMSAIIGIGKVMQAAQSSFISSTNWSERIGPAAALATIKKHLRENAAQYICQIGNEVKRVWAQKAAQHNLDIEISGLPSICHFTFKGEYAQNMNTFFTIEMLKKGILGYCSFRPSFAHSIKEVESYAEAVDEIFSSLSRMDPTTLLSTPPAQAGFFRLMKE